MLQQASSNRSGSWNSESFSIEVPRDAPSSEGDILGRNFATLFGGKEEVLAGLWSPNNGWVKVVRTESSKVQGCASAYASRSTGSTESVRSE